LAKWITTTTLGDSLIQDSGTIVTMGGRALVGAAPLDSNVVSALEVSMGVTATTIHVVSLLATSTVTAHANSDILRGALIYPTFAKSTFAGLTATGLEVAVNTVTGSGTISQYAAVKIFEGNIATSDIGLLINGHPGGSIDYSIYVNSANAMFLGSGAVRLDSQHSTGANTATFTATNKPGSGVTLTPQTWLKLNLGGTDYYIPCWI
jgi:hypothetical protein